MLDNKHNLHFLAARANLYFVLMAEIKIAGDMNENTNCQSDVTAVSKVWNWISWSYFRYSVANRYFSFIRSQRCVLFEVALYLVKTEFASVQVGRVNWLENEINAMFLKNNSWHGLRKLSVVKSAVVHYDNVAILENCWTIYSIYWKSFIKEIQQLHTIRRASQNIKIIHSMYGMK